MTEYKLFTGDVPFVSTPEFHADRERAPHLEQEFHVPRLHAAAGLVQDLADLYGQVTVSDLGCGDGGLLSLVQGMRGVTDCWGYDFSPANAAGWTERGVHALHADVFGADWDSVRLGDVVVMTEVLEHLADPHGVLRRLRGRGVRLLVCSSPWNENPAGHSPEHAWAWDMAGYLHMLEGAGWSVRVQQQASLFQVVLAVAQPEPAVAA
jgi:SAM-dependent methyltransferase